MEEVEILELGFEQQNESCKVNEEEAGGSYSKQSGGDCMLKQESNEAEAAELLEKGYMEYGCSHYRRRCRIRAPCCGEIFDCRHCHNEAKNNINVDRKLRHDIPCRQVSQVICSLCGTEQEVQQVCINCGQILELGCEQQNESCKVNEEEAGGSYSQQSGGDCMLKQESNEAEAAELLEKGYMEYGCSHYRRRCRIRAPCCGEIFDCRHCHNEAKNNINVDQKLRHDIPRRQVSQVICSLCGTEQEVQQVCINCGICMAKYFCETCKLFDDDTSKRQYHCDGCGICRIGGRENFFHCYKCGCCYSILLKNSHPCVEGAMHHDCPVCFEFLFESRYDVTVLPCGHTIHRDCLKEMRDHLQYACPLCSKSVCDMSKVWEKFDKEIAATPMPEPYQNKMVLILCNDCGTKSEVQFHVLARKCPKCKSYNTRQTRG